jgi:hypothetical protein
MLPYLKIGIIPGKPVEVELQINLKSSKIIPGRNKAVKLLLLLFLLPKSKKINLSVA